MPIDYLCNIDLKSNQLLNAAIHPVDTAPSNPVEGQIYYDTTAGKKQLYVWNATIWQGVGHISFFPTENAIASGDTLAFSDESETGVPNNNITIDNLLGTGLQHVGAETIVAGDYITFLDGGADGTAKKGSIHDVAALFAGAGLTATDSVIVVDTLNQDTTGTADKATHVLVSDNESTNEENEITFVEDAAAGGAQRGLESSAKATFNPSSGKITATGFVGALTGNASGSAGTVTSIGNLTGDVTSSNRATTIGPDVVHHAMLNDDIISGQGALTALAQDDIFMVHDTSAAVVKKITYSNLEDDIFGNVTGDGTIAAGGALVITKSDGNFTVTGDLVVSGATTTVNTANLLVEDPLIGLASGNDANSVDIGIWGTYSGSRYTGLFRDASDSNIWKLFATSGNSNEAPGTGTTINTAEGFTLGHLELDTIEATSIILPDDAIAVGKIADGSLPSGVKVNNGNWSGTDLSVGNGGTGASSFTNGGILLGSDAGAITAMAVLTNGQMIVGDGTTDPVAESGATLRTSIGVGTGDSPQFTAIELGAASDTTIARSGAGAITVEGTQVLLAGAALTGSTIDASTDFTIGSTVITDGVITDSSGLSIVAATKITGALITTSTIDIGDDADTTLTRSAAGRVTIQDQQIATSRSYVLAAATSGVAATSTTVFTITHGMGSSFNYMVQVIRNSANSGDGATVMTCVTRTATTIVITFASAPTVGDYTALVVKI